MNLIPRKIIDAEWIKLGQKTYNELLTLKISFTENQPQLNNFLIKFTDHINQEAIDLTFHYSITIWEIFKQAYGKPIPEVSNEIIYSCIEEREQWLEKVNKFSYQEIDKLISKDQTIHQTNILIYAMEAILEEAEDNLDFNEEDHSYLFWLLIIVVDACDKAIS